MSRDLVAILATALAKDPRQRYPSAAALADDLRAWLGRRPTHARPLGPVVRLVRWSRRRKALAGALLGLLATLVAGLSVALALWRAAVDQERRAATLLGEWQRLADRRRLDELVREADVELWPAVPDKVPAMDTWLTRAHALADRHAGHAAALQALRAHGEPGEGEAESAWRRQQLAELVQGLAALASADLLRPTIASVQHRRSRAVDLAWRTLEQPAAAWSAAIARVARDPAYVGLALRPQLGLIPLGPDPASGLEEFADPSTGDVPARGSDGRLACADRCAMVFVLLPGGEFTMGAQAADPRAPNHDPAATHVETPPHVVRLDPFLLAKFEMTHAQWHAVMGDSAGWWEPGRVVRGVAIGWRHPVANVSWELCATMCRRLGWVLPTEAQWEYACRAGTHTPWSTGADPRSLLGSANLADEAARDEYPADWSFHPGTDDGHAVAAPVGSYLPNAFGLHDMHGNVSEWCLDAIVRYDNVVQAGTGERRLEPGREPRHGERLGSRVHRGGSCQAMAPALRSAQRNADQVGMELPSLGVRPTRALTR